MSKHDLAVWTVVAFGGLLFLSSLLNSIFRRKVFGIGQVERLIFAVVGGGVLTVILKSIGA